VQTERVSLRAVAAGGGERWSGGGGKETPGRCAAHLVSCVAGLRGARRIQSERILKIVGDGRQVPGNVLMSSRYATGMGGLPSAYRNRSARAHFHGTPCARPPPGTAAAQAPTLS
jgi:hypothetical protein